MIKVEVSGSDNIERALKTFKRKCNAIGNLRELRDREQFVKPSVKKREQKKKAIYIQKLRQAEDDQY